MEGDIMGELGMIGFNNCQFWFGKTAYHPLYEAVKNESMEMCLKDYAKNKVVNDFVDQVKANVWDPVVFSDLCANALKSGDENLMKFCNELSGKEWQLLMDYCNSKANPVNLI